MNWILQNKANNRNPSQVFSQNFSQRQADEVTQAPNDVIVPFRNEMREVLGKLEAASTNTTKTLIESFSEKQNADLSELLQSICNSKSKLISAVKVFSNSFSQKTEKMKEIENLINTVSNQRKADTFNIKTSISRVAKDLSSLVSTQNKRKPAVCLKKSRKVPKPT